MYFICGADECGLDVLPRIELIRQAGLNFNDIDYFVFHAPQALFNKETLNILGIPSEKIIDTKDYPHIQASKLIVPSIVGGYRGTKWSINFLKSNFLASENKNSFDCERIYISRRKATRRRIANEKEVFNILQQHDFKEVMLEDLSVSKQAEVFFNARIIFAPHGGGLTNIVFSQAATKLIEAFAPDYINPVYWQISSQCNLDYYYLIGENSAASDDCSNDGAKDILLNIDDLKQLLVIVFNS